MKTFNARDVFEAMEIAYKLKEAGEYNWFRGQRENWSLKSSLNRKETEEETKLEIEKLKRYWYWVSITPELESLRQNTDWAIAVAQHHQLFATHFIDFTTDSSIAGFFACAGEKIKETKGPSCIICLNSRKLASTWKKVERANKYPENSTLQLIEVDVPDLWRLEAQSGVFLFCAVRNLENIYSLDRILFPPIETISRPTYEEVFPRKSQLEILLDRFNMNEIRIKNVPKIQELIDTIPKLRVDNFDGFEHYNIRFIENDISKLDSWDKVILDNWVNLEPERYSSVITKEALEASYNIEMSSKDNIKEITFELSTQFEKNPESRKKLLKWSCNICSGKSASPEQKLPLREIEALWDGIRALPYENWELAEGIANGIVMNVLYEQRYRNKYNPWEQIATECFGPIIYIEFGRREDGSYSRGYVNKDNLLSAARRDALDFIKPSSKDLVQEKLADLLHVINDPSYLFDFRKLASLFARQITPTQVLSRRSGLAVFYSPASLDVFGIP